MLTQMLMPRRASTLRCTVMAFTGASKLCINLHTRFLLRLTQHVGCFI